MGSWKADPLSDPDSGQGANAQPGLSLAPAQPVDGKGEFITVKEYLGPQYKCCGDPSDCEGGCE